jgi:hypothetical protein
LDGGSSIRRNAKKGLAEAQAVRQTEGEQIDATQFGFVGHFLFVTRHPPAEMHSAVAEH